MLAPIVNLLSPSSHPYSKVSNINSMGLFITNPDIELNCGPADFANASIQSRSSSSSSSNSFSSSSNSFEGRNIPEPSSNLYGSIPSSPSTDSEDESYLSEDSPAKLQGSPISNGSSASNASLYTTSTIEYSHEPFSTFAPKVCKLCLAIGLGEPVKVERMTGGAYNRVTKLFFDTTIGPCRFPECVLRNPREVPTEDDAANAKKKEIKDQVTVLRLLDRETLIPVPKVLAYDSSSDNAIESSYIVQTCCPGEPLSEIFHELPINEKLEITKLVADLIVRIERVIFPVSGRLISAGDLPDRCDDFSTLRTSIGLAPFRLSPEVDFLSTPPSPSLDVLLASLINTQISLARDLTLPWVIWSRLRQIMLEMKERGLLDDKQPVLWHWDFASWNILVQKEDSRWTITAILDWDGAMSVPRVLTREPPIWLWHRNDQNLSEIRREHDMLVPSELNSEQQLVKNQFDSYMEARVSNYSTDAYNRGRWTRRLAKFALSGFRDEREWENCMRFMKDWDSCRGNYPIIVGSKRRAISSFCFYYLWIPALTWVICQNWKVQSAGSRDN